MVTAGTQAGPTEEIRHGNNSTKSRTKRAMCSQHRGCSMSAAEISSHAADRVRNAVAELSEQADTLTALGATLQDFAGIQFSAPAEELRHIAVGVGATALRAITCAIAAVVVAERLATLARVLEVQS